MKKKYIAVILGIVLSFSGIMAGCSTGSSSSSVSSVSSSSQASDENTVYGKVTKIDGDTITITVGTKSSDSSDLKLSDKTKKITVTDDTTITSGGMGPGGQGGTPPDGNMPSGDSSVSSGSNSSSQPPEMPDNSSTSGSDSSSDNKSSGNTSASGSKPSGSTSASGNQSSGSTSSGSSSSDSSSASGSKPSGNAPSGNAPSGNAPSGNSSSGSAPSGNAPSGNAPSGNGGGQQSLTIDDIAEGDSISVTLNDDGTAKTITLLNGSSGSSGSGGSQDASSVSYTAVNDVTSDTTLSDQDIASSGTDENAILVENGAAATLTGLNISRTSSDSTGGDNSSFYGVGASVLTAKGTSYLSGSTITSDAKGGAGVFSYGDSSKSYVSDTKITTSQDASGGIHVAGGGSLYAWDLDVTTNGESSAAIRSDRGGGTMVVDGGSYTSNGTGSPAIYSTADIAVNGSTLTANGSEAACIEGDNSIHLFDSSLTGNMADDDQNDTTWNVILYQSMSGDSEEGNSSFEMNGGSLTAKNGGMFYTTNTQSTFTLKDVDITYAKDNKFFLQCTGNNNSRGWGTSGSNGADCTFTGISQDMEGDVIWDSISKLNFYMTDGSTLKGAFVDNETYAGEGGDGYANLYIDKNSSWTVTGDSTLTDLCNAGTIQDASGKTVTVKGTDGTVYVKGTSSYTITVSSYSDSADTSKASAISSWSDYETEKPSELS